MLALHQDSTSDVVDNSTPANIKLWDYLVEKCFAHFLASGQAKELPSDDNSSSAGGEEYKCKECSDVFVGPESPDDDGLVLLLHLENHLKTVHNTDCLECTICLVCGYENADENTVNDHVIHGHADVPAGKNLAVVPKPNYHALITAYFPAAAEFTKLRLDPPAGDIRLSNGQICIKGKTLSQNCDEVTEIDEDGNVSTQLACKLCNRFLDCDDLPELVTHAKAHYIIKQFECSRCGFGSNERAALSQHVYLKHRNAAVEILEHDGEIIRKAWTQVVRICFPKLAMKLKKERNARRQRPIKSARRPAAAK